MSAPPAIPYVTEAELLGLEPSNQPMELLDGEIIRPPPPLPEHQDIALTLASPSAPGPAPMTA